MSQTGHIIRKDLRRLRWALAAWAGIVIGRLLLTAAGSTASLEGEGVQFVITGLSGLAGFVETLMLGLLVSWIIHDEPLVGSDAFWLTRPIERRALMAEKLALAAAVLVLVPFLGDLLAMAWFAAGSRDVALATPSELLSQTQWVLLLAALATVTPSLTRFMLAIAGCVAAFTVVVGTIMAVLLLNMREDTTPYDGTSPLPDSTSAIVFSVLVTCVALGVIVYQYRNRWVSRAIAVAAAGVVATLLISAVWPWHFARGVEPDPGPWAHDAARTAAVLDTDVPRDVSDVPSFRRATTPKKRVAARVDLAGLPPDYSVQSVGVRAHLVFPDGGTIESAQRDEAGVRRPSSDRPPDRTARLQAVLGSARLAPLVDDGYERMPVILTVSDRDYERYAAQAGHLTATLDFYLSRFRVFGTLPLAAGAVVRDGTDRFEIVRVLRRSDGCDLVLRQFTVRPLWSAADDRQFHFVLRNGTRGEAFDGDNQMQMPIGVSGLAGFFGVTFYRHPSGFSISISSLRYPGRTPFAAATPRIDGAWLDGAELVVIENAGKGRVTRELSVNGFTIRP